MGHNIQLFNHECLSVQECGKIRSRILSLRGRWEELNPDDPSYLLGVASYKDACGEALSLYYEKARLSNKLLHNNFDWVYEKLAETLTSLLGRGTCFPTHFALPGFHIFLTNQNSRQVDHSIHCDLQYQCHDWQLLGDVDLTNPISYTLAISLPECGGGLNYWNVVYDNSQSLSSKEVQYHIDKENANYHEYEVGKLILHSGLFFHQIMRRTTNQSAKERITLQGHGVLCDGKYQLYW